MIDILLATGNRGKVQELVPLFSPVSFRLLSLEDAGLPGDHEETGSTFHENSASKAVYYSRKTELPVIADDSGLVIDALEGLPGVQSARYPEPDMPYPDRFQYILARMTDHMTPDERSARFICVATLAWKGEVLLQTEGTVSGTITREPAGTGGFGYDPIFFYEPLQRTFAQISLVEKNRLSHRFLAFRLLLAKLPELLL